LATGAEPDAELERDVAKKLPSGVADAVAPVSGASIGLGTDGPALKSRSTKLPLLGSTYADDLIFSDAEFYPRNNELTRQNDAQ
jgi:hypothetical protein